METHKDGLSFPFACGRIYLVSLSLCVTRIFQHDRAKKLKREFSSFFLHTKIQANSFGMVEKLSADSNSSNNNNNQLKFEYNADE